MVEHVFFDCLTKITRTTEEKCAHHSLNVCLPQHFLCSVHHGGGVLSVAHGLDEGTRARRQVVRVNMTRRV